MKNCDCFLIFAEKHSLWVHASTYNLRFIGKKMKNLYPLNPSWYYMKVGCKGVLITQVCYSDVYMYYDDINVHATFNY